LKTVQAIQTSDGKLFLDSQEAEHHEMTTQFSRWCESKICRGGEWTASMVSREILAHWNVSPKG